MLADRFDYRRFLQLGAVTLTAANLIPVFARNHWGFLAHFLLIALAYSFTSGAGSAYVYEYLHRTGRDDLYKQAEGSARAYSLTGRVVALPAAGVLMQWQFTSPYWLSAAATLIALGIALKLPPLPPGEHHHEKLAVREAFAARHLRYPHRDQAGQGRLAHGDRDRRQVRRRDDHAGDRGGLRHRPIGMLVDQLLGREVFYPAQMLITAGRAAASVAVIPTNAAGEPWSTQPLWRPDDVDWSAIVTPGTKLEEIPAFSMPKNEPVPVHDPSGGSRNWLGLFVVTAPDAHQLHRDCRAILNGLEAGLNSVSADR